MTTSKTIFPPTLLCDWYKTGHKPQYPKGTETIYSMWIPRSNRYMPYADKAVVFAIQHMVVKYLINYFNEHFFGRPKDVVVAEYVRYMKFVMFVDNPDASHIEELHDLGHLPLEIKALKEGTRAPIKTPVMTVKNTNKRFFWLTNYFETLISAELWQPMTSATIAYRYREILDEYALKTVGNTEAVKFQAHDFSMRGMVGVEGAAASGAAHLLAFVGSDTPAAIALLEAYYNANIEKELVGTSIPATEHSVMSAGTDADGDRDEYDTFHRLATETYPAGFFSVVSDTYDFWKIVGETLPRLKDVIMGRDGRMVIRPDSGDPVEIICGKEIIIFDSLDDAYDYIIDSVNDEAENGCTDPHQKGESKFTRLYKLDNKYYRAIVNVEYEQHPTSHHYRPQHITTESIEEFTPDISEIGLIEALWNTFGGTLTEKGYKLLDTHIGAIYGDSITPERALAIVKRLETKGFASINIVLGVGSFSYQYTTRDNMGQAMKATYMEVNGKEHMLFKDPKTDDGTKRSLRGLVAVYKNEDGEITFKDGLNRATYEEYADIDLLETVFLNGELVRNQSLSEIRSILHEGRDI